MSEELKTYVILFQRIYPTSTISGTDDEHNAQVVRAIIQRFSTLGAEIVGKDLRPREGLTAKLPKEAVDEITAQFPYDEDGKRPVIMYPLPDVSPKY